MLRNLVLQKSAKARVMLEDTWKWWNAAKKPVLVKESGCFWENSLSLVLFLQLGALECKQGLGAFSGV